MQVEPSTINLIAVWNNILFRHNIATRHCLKIADLFKIGKDGLVITNFDEPYPLSTPVFKLSCDNVNCKVRPSRAAT